MGELAARESSTDEWILNGNGSRDIGRRAESLEFQSWPCEAEFQLIGAQSPVKPATAWGAMHPSAQTEAPGAMSWLENAKTNAGSLDSVFEA